MSPFVRTLTALASFAVVVVLLPTQSAFAQIPDKFENLEVLPKDIGKRELVSIMKGFAGALGVRCNYCHVGENPHSLEGYDFKSDEKETKRIARGMMQMVHAINEELIPAAKVDDPIRVRCVTCHRGLENPETLDRVLEARVEKDGVPATISSYRELRDEYYGSGSYDFGILTLSTVAESVAGKDLDGAIALALLNVEFNPDNAYAHLMLGQLQLTKGDKSAALASVERSLEIEPDNRWAQQMLDKIKASE